MNSRALVAPILPGQLDTFRNFARDIAGSRRREMDESRRALGITRETTFVQPSPMGTLLIVYLEGEDVMRANREFAASTTPFNMWFKQIAHTSTGIDWSQPVPDDSAEVLFEMPVEEHKRSLAVALPVAPGKTEALRKWAKDQVGVNRDKFNDFTRRAGIYRACVYLVHTREGDMAVQYSEGDDPAAAYGYFATSNNAFDVWNREQLAALHGIDFSQPMPGLPELGFDYRNDELLAQMRKEMRTERGTDRGARPSAA